MVENSPLNATVEKAKEIYRAGDFQSAADTFREAAKAYLSKGDTLMAAEMKNNECVALLRAGQLASALEAVNGTADIFNAAEDARRLGTAHANRASVLHGLKRTEDAVVDYIQAADALEKAGEYEMRLEVMQILAGIYLRKGKFINAVMALQSGLAGIKHPTGKQKLLKKLLFFRL